MANQFDLRKFLNENKLTRASRTLNENTGTGYKVELLVPTVYFNVETGEFSDSPYTWGAESELEDLDITSYDNGDELDAVVFSNDIESAEQKAREYPELLKITYLEETKASATLSEGDSFDYSNLVLSTVNSLTDMGKEGQNALRVLEKISDWNELVRLATEE